MAENAYLPEGEYLITLCRREAESQLHLHKCPCVTPFWDLIMNFIEKLGFGRPSRRIAAILFNAWKEKKMAALLPRAILRLAVRMLYGAFTRVDTNGHTFVPEAVYKQVLGALKDILRRRAYTIQRMHANRVNTAHNAIISGDEARLFSELVTMTDAGDVLGYTEIFAAELERAKELAEQAYEHLRQEQQRKRERKEARATRRQRRRTAQPAPMRT